MEATFKTSTDVHNYVKDNTDISVLFEGYEKSTYIPGEDNYDAECCFDTSKKHSLIFNKKKGVFYCATCGVCGDVSVYFSLLNKTSPLDGLQDVIDRYKISLPGNGQYILDKTRAHLSDKNHECVVKQSLCEYEEYDKKD